MREGGTRLCAWRRAIAVNPAVTQWAGYDLSGTL